MLHGIKRRVRAGRGVLAAAVVAAVVLAPGAVLAFSSYGNTWDAAHAGSTSHTNAGCQLCHGNTTSQWNAYGYALRTEYESNGNDMAAAIATVDSKNSDGDPTGSTNAAEAKANAQPGWVYGPFNAIYDAGGVVSTTATVPGGVTGKLDPVTLVTIGDAAFSPTPVTVKLGGSVQWVPGGSGSHNVYEVGGIFSSGSASTATYFNRLFSAGTFSYLDQSNPTMTGVVKAKMKTAASPTGNPFTVTWATAKTNTGTRFNVQYKVGTGSWKTWLSNTTALKGVFGAKGSPIVPAAGKKYSFRVQSGTGTVWSGYSPTASFTP